MEWTASLNCSKHSYSAVSENSSTDDLVTNWLTGWMSPWHCGKALQYLTCDPSDGETYTVQQKAKTKNTAKERSWRLVDLSDIWSQSDEKTWTDKKTKTFWKRFSRLVTISDNWKQKPETLIVILQRDKGQHSQVLRCFQSLIVENLFSKRNQICSHFILEN